MKFTKSWIYFGEGSCNIHLGKQVIFNETKSLRRIETYLDCKFDIGTMKSIFKKHVNLR